MENRFQKLLWIDIAVLSIIKGFIQKHQAPPSQRTLYHPATNGGLINDWLECQNVDHIYSLPITSNATFLASIARLRFAHLLQDSGQYQPTLLAATFLASLPEENRFWPVEIPLNFKGVILKTQAVYLPEF